MNEVTIVKTLTGHKYNVNTKDMKTVKDIKGFIQEVEGMSVEQIKFIADGKLVTDDQPVQSLKEKTIHMVLALRGGC